MPRERTVWGVLMTFGGLDAATAGSWIDVLGGKVRTAGPWQPSVAAGGDRLSPWALRRASGRSRLRATSETQPADRARRLIATVTAAAALITVLVSVVPSVHFAYRTPAAHVVINTAATVIALLAAIPAVSIALTSGVRRCGAICSSLRRSECSLRPACRSRWFRP